MLDVASGLGLAVLACAYALWARGLPLGQGEPGPRFFPLLLAGALLILAVSIVVRGARQRQDLELPPARAAALIFFTILYALSFPLTGFVISTLGYTTGVVLLFEQRGWKAFVIPAATTAVIYAVFVVGLGVVLP